MIGSRRKLKEDELFSSQYVHVWFISLSDYVEDLKFIIFAIFYFPVIKYCKLALSEKNGRHQSSRSHLSNHSSLLGYKRGHSPSVAYTWTFLHDRHETEAELSVYSDHADMQFFRTHNKNSKEVLIFKVVH